MTEDFLKKVTDKAKDVAEDHGDKIEDGIAKVAEFVDDKTGGKHSDKIDDATAKAKKLVDDAGDKPSKRPSRKGKAPSRKGECEAPFRLVKVARAE